MLHQGSRFWGIVVRRRLLLYSFIVSFAVLAVCSKSSFLYPFNDWVDADCYFTVGKGMMQGKVVYRDLFEQKGVLLYCCTGWRIPYLTPRSSVYSSSRWLRGQRISIMRPRLRRCL